MNNDYKKEWYQEACEKIAENWFNTQTELWDKLNRQQKEIFDLRESVIKRFLKLAGLKSDIKAVPGLRQVFSGDLWWLEYYNMRCTPKYKGIEKQPEETPHIDLRPTQDSLNKMRFKQEFEGKYIFGLNPANNGFTCFANKRYPILTDDAVTAMSLSLQTMFNTKKTMKKETIKFTEPEIRTQTRVEQAESIIRTNLHPSNETRNNWLALFGVSDEAKEIRNKRCLLWDEETQSAKTCPYKQGEMIAVRDHETSEWMLRQFKEIKDNSEIITFPGTSWKFHKPLSEFNK